MTWPMYYVLDGHTPVPDPDMLHWSQWFHLADRHVAQTIVTIDGLDVHISTVFLGLDHQWGSGPPILFETMIFGGVNDQEQWRYHTWDEAMTGHEQACVLVSSGTGLVQKVARKVARKGEV